MTVRINKPALNLREELTKAQGVVRYEQRQFWMDGFVENGTFDSDTGWVVTSPSYISGGVLTVADTGGSDDVAVNAGGTLFPHTKAAKITFTISNSTANVGVRLGFYRSANSRISFVANGDYYTSEVTHTIYVPPNTSSEDWYIGFYRVGSHTGTLDIDNVAVFEVDENDNVIHSVPLGFKPVHVYEDGLLQREGENHDYTVTDTGFGYQIKPTVTPSATTETCVIAEREL